LFSIGAAIAVLIIWKDARRPQVVRPVLTVLTTIAIALAAVYPVVAARAWSFDFNDWRGVDGAAYVGDWSPGELAAINWLRENADDDDVLLEQVGCQYQPVYWPPDYIPRLSRMSTFTGVPTIVGWGGTEGQWRAGQQEIRDSIGPREDDMQLMYTNPSDGLFDKYGVTYVVVGKYELEGLDTCDKAIPYPNAAESTFPGPGWDEVFNQDGVKILHRAGAN
jgi:uncharacterized membrane protein